MRPSARRTLWRSFSLAAGGARCGAHNEGRSEWARAARERVRFSGCRMRHSASHCTLAVFRLSGAGPRPRRAGAGSGGAHYALAVFACQALSSSRCSDGASPAIGGPGPRGLRLNFRFVGAPAWAGRPRAVCALRMASWGWSPRGPAPRAPARGVFCLGVGRGSPADRQGEANTSPSGPSAPVSVSPSPGAPGSASMSCTPMFW